MAPPNLKDPAERAAYRAELAGVARGIRLVGVLLAAAGALLVAAAKRGAPVPMWLACSVLGFGVMLLITAGAARSRYNQLRMRP